MVGIVCSGVLAAVAVLVAAYVPFPTWAQVLIVVAPGCAIMFPAFVVDRKAAAPKRGEDEGDRNGS